MSLCERGGNVGIRQLSLKNPLFGLHGIDRTRDVVRRLQGEAPAWYDDLRDSAGFPFLPICPQRVLLLAMC